MSSDSYPCQEIVEVCLSCKLAHISFKDMTTEHRSGWFPTRGVEHELPEASFGLVCIPYLDHRNAHSVILAWEDLIMGTLNLNT